MTILFEQSSKRSFIRYNACWDRERIFSKYRTGCKYYNIEHSNAFKSISQECSRLEQHLRSPRAAGSGYEAKRAPADDAFNRIVAFTHKAAATILENIAPNKKQFSCANSERHVPPYSCNVCTTPSSYWNFTGSMTSKKITFT